MVILAGLEAILGRLGAILGPLGPNLGRFGRSRGPKREAKRDPRGTQNETKITSKCWLIFGSILERFGRPRGPASGRLAECAGLGLTLLSSKNSKTVQSRSDPSGGGGLTSPRGITAARPPFFFLRFGARPLGYVDFGDLKNLLCLLEPLGVVLGRSWSPLPPPSASEQIDTSTPHFPFPPQIAPQLHLNFTTQNHLNITSFLTLRGSHFDPPWATHIDSRSAQIAS